MRQAFCSMLTSPCRTILTDTLPTTTRVPSWSVFSWENWITVRAWIFRPAISHSSALPSILTTTSPRAWAFALIGISEYSQKYRGDRMASQVSEELAGRLLRLYQDNRSDDWRWFERKLTYCNAALPHALLICGRSLSNSALTEAGLESLQWLASLQSSSD